MHISSRLKIAYVTNARSEYGLVKWLLTDIKNQDEFELHLIVGGAHLMRSMGYTADEIEQDGFVISKKISHDVETLDPLSLVSIGASMAVQYAEALDEIRPDLILFMGDRNELLSVVTAGTLLNIPMGHISGGEVTEGAIDDQIRHAVSKLSHLHFVANEVYATRVRQLGEEDWRICISGEPGLDHFNRGKVLSRTELSASVGLDLAKPTALVTFHPVTQELSELDKQMDVLISVLQSFGMQYLITFPGADPGSDRIINTWQNFVRNRADRVLLKSLGHSRYASALFHCNLMIGNSSSGLVESVVPNIPVVNIGNRQKGRLHGANVFSVEHTFEEICVAVERALTFNREVPSKSIYGDGCASKRITEFISYTFKEYSRDSILTKKFIDR